MTKSFKRQQHNKQEKQTKARLEKLCQILKKKKKVQRNCTQVHPRNDSIAWSLIPRGNDTHFTVVLLERFGILAEYQHVWWETQPSLLENLGSFGSLRASRFGPPKT
ncbi:hypothetical protein PIB30_040569 [Stylosanthes scabra]|uniref:Ribosomal protein S14 n=1 Tax=Stylosanthes scabra TaxID=79078 RepID=A0ABU6XCN1_9FABA|nr:hypothetical protein [Stylosanthes scabra]